MNASARLTALALLQLALVASAACSKQVVCSSDEISWQGQCLNLSSDEKNCGSPGLACPQGELCVTGSCCSGPTCSPTIFLACFDNAQVRGATASLELVGAPVQVDTGPVSFARRGTELWVANSESNTLDQIGLGFSTPVSSVTIPQSGQFSDLEYLASAGGLLYASNDAVGSLVVVDPAIGPVAEIQFGPASYPQGIAFGATTTRAYVALNGADAIAVVDLSAQSFTTIDLSGLASPGAMAMPSRLLLDGTRLYVTLWNLVQSTFTPGGNGRLAVIDTTTGALVPGVNPVDLGPGCLDPGGLALRDGTIYVTCGFFDYNSTVITGAGIVPVDVSGTAPAVKAMVATPGTAPGAIAFCGDLAFVGDRASGNVVRFDPVHGAVTPTALLCVPAAGMSGYVADVTCGQ